MEIIVHQAILHVLDTTLDAPVLSGSCMEMTAEKTAYLQYHIEKLLASDDIRQCRPLPDSAFRYELEQNKDFIDLSCRSYHHSGGRPRCGGLHPGRPAVAGHPQAQL